VWKREGPVARKEIRWRSKRTGKSRRRLEGGKENGLIANNDRGRFFARSAGVRGRIVAQEGINDSAAEGWNRDGGYDPFKNSVRCEEGKCNPPVRRGW